MGTYRLDRGYDWNYRHGPSWDGPLPRAPRTPAKRFLGVEVSSRFGIAAGLLLNSRWIDFYRRCGFDILTYKTVRLRRRRSHPLPNWIYLDAAAPLEGDSRPALRRSRPPRDPAQATAAVSFGMPSKDPEIWTADLRRARAHLGRGQVLVVSVVASPASGASANEIVEEYSALAALAAPCGVHAIEANLSCPNVTSPEGQVYRDPALSRRVARAMAKAAGKVPVTMKAGYFGERAALRRFLRAVAGAARAVVLVNGISRRIVDGNGAPAFGRGREVAGVLGRAIHEPCLGEVRAAVEISGRERLGLEVIAVGGVLAPEDAGRYFDAGAHAVLCGGGPMEQPGLAAEIKRRHPEW